MSKLTENDVKIYLHAEKLFLNRKNIIISRVEEILWLIHTALYPKANVLIYSPKIDIKKSDLICDKSHLFVYYKIDCPGVCHSTSIDTQHPLDLRGNKFDINIDVDYSKCFPIKFLYMDNDTIKLYITNQIELEQRNKELYNEKMMKDKKKMALNKLTKEEIELLGIKI